MSADLLDREQDPPSGGGQMKEGKAGRPKLAHGQARDRIISIKLRQHEVEWLRAQAKKEGKALSRYVREILFERHRGVSP